MTLMRPFTSLREDINRLFGEMDRDLFTPVIPRTRIGEAVGEMINVWTPPVDVIDEENEIKIKAQVPGITPDNLNIEVENTSFTLSGETMKPEEEIKGNVYRQEICYGKFFRRVALPVEVQADKARADFENGLLTVSLPKVEQTRRHRIKISR